MHKEVKRLRGNVKNQIDDCLQALSDDYNMEFREFKGNKYIYYADLPERAEDININSIDMAIKKLNILGLDVDLSISLVTDRGYGSHARYTKTLLLNIEKYGNSKVTSFSLTIYDDSILNEEDTDLAGFDFD